MAEREDEFRAVARITDQPLGIGVEWLEGVSYDDDDDLDDGTVLYVRTSQGHACPHFVWVIAKEAGWVRCAVCDYQRLGVAPDLDRQVPSDG